MNRLLRPAVLLIASALLAACSSNAVAPSPVVPVQSSAFLPLTASQQSAALATLSKVPSIKGEVFNASSVTLTPSPNCGANQAGEVKFTTAGTGAGPFTSPYKASGTWAFDLMLVQDANASILFQYGLLSADVEITTKGGYQLGSCGGLGATTTNFHYVAMFTNANGNMVSKQSGNASTTGINAKFNIKLH